MFASKADSVQIAEDALSVLDIPEGQNEELLIQRQGSMTDTAKLKGEKSALLHLKQGAQEAGMAETQKSNDASPHGQSTDPKFRATASFYSLVNTRNTAMFQESKSSISMYKNDEDTDFKGPIPYHKTFTTHKLSKAVNE